VAHTKPIVKMISPSTVRTTAEMVSSTGVTPVPRLFLSFYAESMVCKAREAWQMLEMDFTRAERRGRSESSPPQLKG